MTGGALGRALLCLLPLLTCALRLTDVPLHLHDFEDSWVGEVGFFLVRGGASAFVEYQVDLYRGSSWIDATFAALGSLVFSDGFLAWRWVGLGYVLGITWLMQDLLHRAEQPRAAILFPVLFAAAPFVVRDGAIAMVGSHATTLFWVLLALRCGESSGPRKRSVLLGAAVLGMAIWYTRTAICFTPAFGLLAWRRAGVTGLGRLALGLLTFPLLCGLQSALVLTSSRAESIFAFHDVFLQVMWTIKQSSASDASVLAKLPDVVGATFADRLFGLPRPLAWSPPLAGTAAAAGMLWSIALAGGLAYGVWGAVRREGSPLAQAVASLPALHAVAYVLSGSRVESSLFFDGVDWAPGPTEVRYVALALIATLAPLAMLLTRVSLRMPRVGLGLVAVLALPSLVLQLAHPRPSDRPRVEDLRAFRGGGIYRVPPDKAVAEARTMPEGYARATHYRLAGFNSRAAQHGVEGGWRSLLEHFPGEEGSSALDRAFFAEGVGRRLGDLMSEGVSVAELLAAIPPEDAQINSSELEALWLGLGEAPPIAGDQHGWTGRQLCEAAPRLCWTVSARSVGALETVTGLSAEEALAALDLPEELRSGRERELAFGLGYGLGGWRTSPRVEPRMVLGPEQASEFEAGLRAARRFVWRSDARYVPGQL